MVFDRYRLATSSGAVGSFRDWEDEEEDVHNYEHYQRRNMADRHPRDTRHSSKPYSPSTSTSKPRGHSRSTPFSPPQRGGAEDEFQQGSSRGPPSPVREQQELATPGPERPVCLVRGSLYIEDYIEVPSLVSSGETITSNNTISSLGGKGLIQAIAIARAGQRVELVAAIGPDGASIPEYVASFGVGSRACRIQSVRTASGAPILTGRSVRQYSLSGEAATILIPGMNNCPADTASEALYPPITHLVLQNEIGAEITLEYINVAHERRIPIILNPSPLPFDDDLRRFPWEKVNYLVMSEEDAETLANALGLESDSASSSSRRHASRSRSSQGESSAGAGPSRTAGQSSSPPLITRFAGHNRPPSKQAVATLHALMTWRPLASTGIVLKLNSPGGGILAALPAATAGETFKVYYEPAPLPEIASRLRRDDTIASGQGSVDAVLGYFVAGLMEFALVNPIQEEVWKGILEKAAAASYMTSTSFPPVPPLPIDAFPDFQAVMTMVAHLRAGYQRQQRSQTSLRPFPTSQSEPSPTSPTSFSSSISSFDPRTQYRGRSSTSASGSSIPYSTTQASSGPSTGASPSSLR